MVDELSEHDEDGADVRAWWPVERERLSAAGVGGRDTNSRSVVGAGALDLDVPPHRGTLA